MNNFIPVNSVGQYLSCLEKYLHNKLWNNVYRGEDRDFNNTALTANLYRSMPVKGKTYFRYNTWETYLNASKSFYKNTSNLSKIAYNNFMELCQHHGLPTPLLDVSLSPLVALYFASKENNSDGDVYIFNKDRFVPFSNEIFSYNYLSQCFNDDYFPLDMHKFKNVQKIVFSINSLISNANKGQLQYIQLLTSTTMIEFIKYFKKYHVTYRSHGNRIVLNTLQKYNTPTKLYVYILNRQTGIFSNNISSFNMHFKIFLEKLENKNFEKRISHYKIRSYANIIGFFIYFANKYCRKSDNQFIPSNLNLFVNSTVNWNRIKAQRGGFIIQIPFRLNTKNYNHLSEDDNTKTKSSIKDNKPYILNKPKYHYDFIIKRNAKHVIRKELDAMGINKMNLFMDNDDIASYIKKKYYID